MRFRSLLLFLLTAAVVRAQDPSPYFPERGDAALQQRALELMKPLMVLSLSLEPGFEDLTTLASLRLGAGARFVSAYATNGQATRSDLNGDPPSRVAARRREEAFRASARLGGETHFLNLPDFGVVSDPAHLDAAWGVDTLARALAAIFRTYRPDVVLLAPDFREKGGSSPRFLRLREALISAAGIVERPPKSGAGPRADRPVVLRCAEEQDNGGLVSPVARDAVHPVWRRSYREIAAESRKEYLSLRTQIARWNSGERGRYTVLRGAGGKPSRFMTEGLPVLGQRMKELAAEVARSAGKARKESQPRALATIAGTVRRVEKFFMEQQQSLTGTERRVVAGWRVGLDNLRCSVMGVEVAFETPDSLIAESHVFFLRCRAIGAAAPTDSTKILFPSAMDGSWRINESALSEFPLSVPSEFRVLTPPELDLDLPGSVNGINRALPRKKFPVIVIHEDRDWTRNYAYRKDFLFRAGPRRSLELLTPVVRVVAGERLVLSFQNFSRDAFRGEVAVGDSVVRVSRTTVTLPAKDAVSIDTLLLGWSAEVADGDHIVEIRVSKKPAGRFLARKFTATADTSQTVGLITGLEDSPVGETLRRMRVPAVSIEGIPDGGEGLAHLQAIVVDRDALTLRADLRPRLHVIEEWVRSGGHLVILPQADDGRSSTGSIGGIRFRGDAVRPATTPVILEVESRMVDGPNRLAPDDFDGWIIARTLGEIVLPEDSNVVVHIRDAASRRPLAASLPLGAGTITVTSLDLLPQLEIIHPGAFRLLGNFISSRPRPH